MVLSPHPAKSADVYHIVNPNISASWDDILAALKVAGLEFETVNRTEWVQRLARSDSDGAKNPTIKLLVSSFLLPLFQNGSLTLNAIAVLPDALRKGLSPTDALLD